MLNIESLWPLSSDASSLSFDLDMYASDPPFFNDGLSGAPLAGLGETRGASFMLIKRRPMTTGESFGCSRFTPNPHRLLLSLTSENVSLQIR